MPVYLDGGALSYETGRVLLDALTGDRFTPPSRFHSHELAEEQLKVGF
jgi:hypothetical protein